MSFLLIALAVVLAFGSPQPQSEQLLKEYQALKELTQSLQAEELVGGVYHSKKFEGYEILWDKNDFEVDGHDTLRIFKPRSGLVDESFAVTYIYSKYLIANTVTLRRFVGREPRGWRADTMNVETGEYLGYQGISLPRLSEEEQAILDLYQVELFE